MKRPSRESGEVRGSEIMKNVKISSEPLCSWWIGMASGSPSHQARANSSAAWLPRKKIAMSERRAACSTRMAKKPTSAANHTVEPQAPGEIHTPPDANSSTTMAKPAGFQMCLPSMRKTNFEPIAITPASACSQGFVGAQQQAERQAGDQRRARIECRQLEPPGAERLGGERAADRERAVERPRAEVEPADVVDQQGRERGDLVVARIGPERSCEQTLQHARLLSAPGRTLMKPQSDAMWAERGPDCDQTAEYRGCAH